MIIFILFVFYALYFIILYNSNLEKVEPATHITLMIPFWLIVLSGIFWGYTTNPYGDFLRIKSCLWWSRTDMEVLFFITVFIALALSYCNMYRLGQESGIKSMRHLRHNRD
jgi:hypothetical protein